MTDEHLNELLGRLDAAAVNGWLNEDAAAKAICYLRAEVSKLRAERDELREKVKRYEDELFDLREDLAHALESNVDD